MKRGREGEEGRTFKSAAAFYSCLLEIFFIATEVAAAAFSLSAAASALCGYREGRLPRRASLSLSAGRGTKYKKQRVTSAPRVRGLTYWTVYIGRVSV